MRSNLPASRRRRLLTEQVNNPENLNPVPSEPDQIKANYYNSIKLFS
jgi:hypothetical protein